MFFLVPWEEIREWRTCGFTACVHGFAAKTKALESEIPPATHAIFTSTKWPTPFKQPQSISLRVAI